MDDCPVSPTLDRWAGPSKNQPGREDTTVRLQGESDRRGVILVAVIVLLIVIAVAAYLLFVAPGI